MIEKTRSYWMSVRKSNIIPAGIIEGSINIPVDSLRDKLRELDKTKEILEYCQIGLRGYVASRILTQNGFKVKNIDGGYKSCLMSPFKPTTVDPVRNTR